ncbi:hypothetical protein [Corynebacterium freiburgense]|uniref:hypothetical protein n=1 Tax=Corynebacterium freiburgense TaxID=556548 RepID=UPI00047A85DB|nr:hypothetical protein [Corynebacterium freiburgense]WJZ01876.1 hypothetical protein CFREI_02860 [Corynebacterium freiburgense]
MFLITSCSANNVPLPNANDLFLGRDPDQPVIKDVSELGICSPYIVSLEYQTDGSAKLIYRGQPGDEVNYTLRYTDRGEEERQANEQQKLVKITTLSPEETKNLRQVQVAATGDIGVPNSCVIEI